MVPVSRNCLSLMEPAHSTKTESSLVVPERPFPSRLGAMEVRAEDRGRQRWGCLHAEEGGGTHRASVGQSIL